MNRMYRIEKDSLGEQKVPIDAYYGIQTLRAKENFPITGVKIHQELIVALAYIKKAAALANMETHMLTPRIGQALIQACNEVIAGKLNDHFIVDSIQGGAGTSINMNMNEVLANRTLEILGRKKGEYFYCSPNTHVNMSQSTNDTVPTAIKLSAYKLVQELLVELRELQNTFATKAEAFDSIIKMGRTHLQDAVPIRLGQEFGAYAEVIKRDMLRISQAAQAMVTVNLGATAVGTGLNANTAYVEKVFAYLADFTGYPIKPAEDLIDATQNTDAYTALSATLKVAAVNLSKISNDIRLMASGPYTGFNELNLPPRQPGSSIMPGKVNPVMVEVMNQVAFQVMGNDYTVTMAAEAGQLELNVMGPVIAFNLLQSLEIMKNGIKVFRQYAIVGLEANQATCKDYVDKSYGIITALNPHLGYETAARIVKEAVKTGQTIKEICLEQHLLSKEELDEILDPYEMTSPGIAGNRFLTAK